MADEIRNEKIGSTENISPKGSPIPITGTTLLMVIVFAVIFIIGIFLIGGFLSFGNGDANQNTSSVEGNVGP